MKEETSTSGWRSFGLRFARVAAHGVQHFLPVNGNF
jgi:hypothetical protein